MEVVRKSLAPICLQAEIGGLGEDLWVWCGPVEYGSGPSRRLSVGGVREGQGRDNV